MIITPAAMQSYAREVHAGMLALQSDVSRDAALLNQRAPAFLPAWRTVRDNWTAFYHEGVFWWAGDFETIRRFAEYLAGWRLAYERAVGHAATGPAVTTQPTEADARAWDRAISIGWLLGMTALGYVGYKVFRELRS